MFDETLPFFLQDAVDRATQSLPSGGPLDELRIFLTHGNSPIATPSSKADLLVAAGAVGEVGEELAAASGLLVLFVSGTEIDAVFTLGDLKPFRLEVIALPETVGRRSGRKPASAGRHIVIVGAGSVGSKLAECLMRSGIHQQTLVDGDILLPANLERHALDWRDVGFRKVNGLRRRLLQIVPNADVHIVTTNLNWQRSARTHAHQIESIAGCDLIVDATGDVPTSLFLGAVAAANERPFVSVEVFEGGIGALIASCLPGRDPAYATARAAFLSWCEQQQAPLVKSAGRPYEAWSEEGEPLVADDAAVTSAAGHAARIVLDILDGEPATPDASWLLMGFKKAWVFDGHGHTLRLNMGPPPSEDAATSDAEAQSFALRLVEEAHRASSAPE